MKIRPSQIVLITFAVASWFGAIVELGAASGCGSDDCLEHGSNCSEAYLKEHGKQGSSCCEGEVCCTLKNGSGVATCQSSGACQ